VCSSTDGIGTSGTINLPYGVWPDQAGNLYINDNTGAKIRRVSPTGVMLTIAGSGVAGSANGIGTAAQFNAPLGICSSPDGTVYIADAINQQIRMLSPPRSTTVGAVFSAPVCDGAYHHHVAVTFDGSTVNVYVDGDVYATTPLLINTANGNPTAL
jgi:streptogramin lyase